MIKDYFFPTEKNKFTPHLLSRVALLTYIVSIFFLNSILSATGLFKVNAAVTLESLLTLHNQERNRFGLQELTLNPLLSESALQKAEIMLETDCWSHYCPQGVSPWEFFIGAGYYYEHAGENLAEGFNSVEAVVSAWMNSPAHRDNMLNGDFSEIGFGMIYGNYQGKENNLIIVVHFGSPLQINNKQINDVSASEINVEEGFITINNLSDDLRLPDNLIEIEGNVNPQNSEVNIFIDDELKGTVEANGPAYSYTSTNKLPDGRYKIIASTKEFDNVSETVTVYLDEDSPVIFQDKLTITRLSDELRISLKTSQDVVEVSTIPPNERVERLSDGQTWNIIFSNDLQEEEIKIIIKDGIGQLSEAEVNINEKNLTQTNSSNIIDLPGLFIEKLENGGTFLISILFFLYISILLIIDFAILSKKNLLGKVSRKSHIHLGIFFITFMVILFGGIGGNIL